LGFPPYSQIFRFIVSDENEKRAQQYVDAAATHLRQLIRERVAENPQLVRMTLMGPAPCVMPRIQSRYRYHLLVKNFAGEAGHRLITHFYQRAMESSVPKDLNFILDIDAQSLL
jgi:primosomal protein N'